VLRSILVALDATPASSEAQRLAVDMAKRQDAQITGLAILDRGHITSPTAVGIGGMAYKHHRDQVKLEEAKAFLQRLEKGFQQSCEAIGTAWRVIEAEGVPYKLIEVESGRHDLLVIGKDTDFHFGFARERPIHVLAVAADRQTAEDRARYPTELFAKHGYEATPHGIGSNAEPAEIMLTEAEALGATLVAMGASGHRPLYDFFLGSTTQRLLNACPCTLFVHH
jgi:nucleotide-binding universal stress UspA family protein